jgi:transcriptional regulator with XRE-family HTH domain
MLLNFPVADITLQPFGRRLQATRRARGVELEWLADRAAVSRLTLALAEQGRARLSSAELHRIVNALGLSLQFLQTDADPARLRPFRLH